MSKLNIIEEFEKDFESLWEVTTDNNGEKDQHLGLFDGNINYQAIIASILKSKWRGLIAFETRGTPPKENILDLFQIYRQTKNEN